jgi:hypothetical protein
LGFTGEATSTRKTRRPRDRERQHGVRSFGGTIDIRSREHEPLAMARFLLAPKSMKLIDGLLEGEIQRDRFVIGERERLREVDAADALGSASGHDRYCWVRAEDFRFTPKS